jgi:hypothetical protein
MAALKQQFAFTSHRGDARTADTVPDCMADTAKSSAIRQLCTLPVCRLIRPEIPGLQPSPAKHILITLVLISLILCAGQASACCNQISPDAETQTTRVEHEAKPGHAVIALATEATAPAAQQDIESDATSALAAVAESNFVKISDTGSALAENTAKWECVEDKSNHLTWEVKKSDGGVRDKDSSYSWLSNINGQSSGASNGGRCEGGIDCDTSSYVRAINAEKLCGYSDWRLPTRAELETLVEYNNNPKNATINKTYFPEAVASWYWTASEHPLRNSYAWYVLFHNGIALNDLKERPKHIRLVRGNAVQ